MAEGTPLSYPEGRWERGKPLPTVDDALVAQHLEAWPELLGRPWELLTGGLRSLNIRIGEFVLRVASDDGGNLAVEAALLQRVAVDIRVPRVLGRAGHALLLEYVDLVELPATALAGKRVGRAAGYLRQHAFEAAGDFDEQLAIPKPFESAYDGLRGWAETILQGSVGERLGPDATELRRLWDRNERRMRGIAGDPVLVHSDFKPANVKWLPLEQEVIVLDWEFSWAGPELFDVGMMLRWGAPEAFIQGLEQGYIETGGKLPTDWRYQGQLFDAFNLVGLLEGAQEGSRRDKDVTRRLRQTLRSTSG